MEITRQLAEFAASLSFEDIPNEVTERAKRLVLDLTGIMIRARHDAESTPSPSSFHPTLSFYPWLWRRGGNHNTEAGDCGVE